MSSDRWNQIKEVVASALELEDRERTDYLDRACGTDTVLRQEVERLIREDREAGSFLQLPIAVPLDAKLEGKRLGPYQVESVIERGGMGVVYRARDTRLNRLLAIKVLPPHAAGDLERRARFEHEARTASSLNHPNIVVIYDIGRVEDRDFLAMEFVEGKSLDKLIRRKPLSLGDALKYGVQITAALAAAHSKNIIHRDIKPANIMVTPTGLVKVLDFGIAKLSEPVNGLVTTSLELSAEEKPRTAKGVILGTVSYMSPEQAEGKPVDARSDIFSFGAMLHEMISGQKAFAGDTMTRILSSILEREPKALSKLIPDVPGEVERVVARCLKKDPARRFQHMDDLRVALQELSEEYETRRLAPSKTAKKELRSSRRLSWIFPSGLALLFIGAMAGWLLKPVTSRPRGSMESTHPLEAFPSWSADGKWIAYASNQNGSLEIWKKPAAGGKELPLTATPDINETQPAWSPSDTTIAFASDKGGIFLIPSNGGKATQLTTFGANPKWSPDGKRIAFDWQGSLYLIRIGGGAPETLVENTSSTQPHLAWSPDGKRIIYWNRTQRDLCLLTVEDGRASKSELLGLIRAGHEVSGISWSNDGQWLVFSQGPLGGNKNLWRVAMAGTKPAGVPVRLTVSPGDELYCNLSPDGNKLAYTIRQIERHLWTIPLDTSTGLSSGTPHQITSKSQFNYYPSLSPKTSQGEQHLVWTQQAGGQGVLSYKRLGSDEELTVTAESDRSGREIGASFAPDGKQIVYASTRGGSYQLWRIREIGSVSFQLTETQRNITDAQTAWSPDGSTIAFYSNRSGNWDIWCVDVVKGGEPYPLTPWESDEMYPAWHPSGRYLAFRSDRKEGTEPNRGGNPDIWVFDFKSREFYRYIQHPAEEAYSVWSPDGRYFYFSSNRSGEFNIYVTPISSDKPQESPPTAVTAFKGYIGVLPESALFTKFAVTQSQLIVPLETTRKSDIYILENLNRPIDSMATYLFR